MTKDNMGRRNDQGEPGVHMEPSDVIRCRECGGMVRRLNSQHLQTDRCMYVDQDKFDDPNQKRQDHPTTVQDYKQKYPDAPVMSPREKMNLVEQNSNPEVDNRRREMLKRRWRGEAMTDIASTLAANHGVSESTIRKDWSNRDDWIARVFGLADAESVVAEALAQKQDVRERLLGIAQQAERNQETAEAIRALKAVDSNIDSSIEHQQELGNVAKAASKHEVEVSGDVEHDHRHKAVGDDLDADQLEAIDAITGGEDEDVVDAEFYEVDEEDDG